MLAFHLAISRLLSFGITSRPITGPVGAAADRFPRAIETECLASAHAGSPWRRRWSSYRRQDCPGSGERVSTLLRDSLDHTPPPLIVPSKPGFRVLVSPRRVRPF